MDFFNDIVELFTDLSGTTYMIIVIVGVALCILVAALLTNRPKVSSILVTLIALGLLVWKGYEYGRFFFGGSMFPYEISHWAYLLLGVVVLFSIKPLYLLAGYLATISGIGYLIGAIFGADSMIATNTYYPIYLSLLSHLLLLFAGLLLVFNVRRYKGSDAVFGLLGLNVLIAYGYLLYEGVIYSDYTSIIKTSVIYKIISGDLLDLAIGNSGFVAEEWMYICLPIAIFGLAVLLLFFFFAINRGLFNARARKVSLKPAKYPLTPVGPFELIKYAATGRKDRRELLVYKLNACA